MVISFLRMRPTMFKIVAVAPRNKLQQHKDDFEKHPISHQYVSLVDDDYKVKANIAVVLHDNMEEGMI